MTTLSYLLTASLYLLLFYGCYALLLRRNTFFGLNRAYLLVSVVLSFLLPLVVLPGGTANVLPMGTITLPAISVGNTQPVQSDGLSVTQWILLLYGVGVVVMLIRLVAHIRAVFRLIRRGNAEQMTAFTLICLPDNSTPSFSFGRYLVLNQADNQTRPEALMRHEAAHIRQWHTADILLLEIAQAFFWFNPLLWFYKLALQEVHEFLADRAAIRQISVDEHNHNPGTTQPAYAQQLVAYALDVPLMALTTPFASKSTLKQRIVMLQKPQTHRRALLGYALALPLAALLVMCTQPDKDQPQRETAAASQQNSVRTSAKIDGPVFTVVEQQPEFKGGMGGLITYLQENLKYPERAQKANVSGRVFVNFIVSTTGEVFDVKVLKGFGFGADEEAVRVVQNMPRWEPARQSGKVVNVRFNLPINFALEPGALEEKPGVVAPPPPPVPANDASALDGVKKFVINGKVVTKEDVTTLSPNKIARVDVNKESGTIIVTTK